MKRILVVDDDEDVIFLLKSALKREGYEVFEAMSGEECLSRIDEYNPDIIFLDIMMPGLDGWETCKKIKKTRNNLPVCMLSVRREEEDIRRSLEYARADCHMSKPLDVDKLMAKIGEFSSKN